MLELGVVNGLREMGYGSEDVPGFVKGTLPQVCNVSYCMTGYPRLVYPFLQERVTKLSPRSFTEEQLAKLFEDTLVIY